MIQRKTYSTFLTPGTGFPKYQLEKAGDPDPVQVWTNEGVTRRSDSTDNPVNSYFVDLDINPDGYYSISWDAGIGTIRTDDFAGSANQTGDSFPVAESIQEDYQQRDSAVTLPESPPNGYGIPVPDPGARTVNHNYPEVDALRYTNAQGVGISGGLIRVYLATDYTAGRISVPYIICDVTTGTDGRWLAPAMLSPGNYILIFWKPGVYQATVVQLTVS